MALHHKSNKQLKSIEFFLLFLLQMLLFYGCEEEKSRPREYPRLKTMEVSGISEAGATFNGELYSAGTESIIQHGFVWNNAVDMDVSYSNKILLGPIENTGTFSAVISTTLVKGTKYYVKPFAITPEHVVYGPAMTFSSLGSEAPVIFSFEPDSAGWMDTVKITGKNFSWVSRLNIVKFNQIACVTLASTDTTLLVRVNPDINVISNAISVNLAGNGAEYTKKTFRLIPPSISDFNPKKARWGDTIYLSGKYLNQFSYMKSNYVKLGIVPCTFLGYKNDSLIFKIPVELKSPSSNLSLSINSFNLKSDVPFQLVLPEIADYSPKEAMWADTLRLKGRNLKYFYKLIGLSIMFGTVPGSIISIENDSVMTIRVPYELSTNSSFISILSNGINNQNYEPFKLIGPSFSINPKGGTWGTSISLTGNFNTIAARNSVFFDDIQATITSTSAKLLTVNVPSSLSRSKTNIIYKASPFTVLAADTFLLASPVITSYLPNEATWGTLITMNGVFNPDISKNTILFNDVNATIISATSNILKVQVPNSISVLKSGITLKVNSFTVTATDTFHLFQPIVKSFFPLSGPSGTNVTIKGKYLRNSNTLIVKFGNNAADYSSINDSTISATVPSGISGPGKITVVQSITAVSADDFIVTNPLISNIYPLTGNFNDEITIDGNNFVSNGINSSVKFGTLPATIKSISNNKIVVYVPSALDSIPRKIIVTLLSGSVTSTESFTLAPPEILSVQPASFSILDTIIIRGTGFCPVASLNRVYIDGYTMSVKSSTTTEMKLLPPKSLPGGFLSNITLVSGNYRRSFPLNFTFRSNWSKIQPTVPFSWNSGSVINQSGVSFSLNGKGFMMDYTNAKMTSYDPSSNESVVIGSFSQFKGVSGLTCCVNNDTAYIIAGNLGVFRFDLPTNNWIMIGYSPTLYRNGIAFSLKGKLYYGLANSNGLLENMWMYNSVYKTWIIVKKFPLFSVQYPVASFTINNKGYVVFLDNIFCEYNPDTDSWTKLTSYPGAGYYLFGRVSFVINNLGYVGLGKTSYGDQSYDEFWIYNPGTSNWTQSISAPAGGRFNAVSFVVNNKAYLGFGYKSTTAQNDFYEFDPNYTLK